MKYGICIKIFAVLAAMLMIVCALPMSVFATGEDTTSTTTTTTTATTTTTTAAPRVAVSLSNLYVKGSNQKFYLCSPELSDTVDAYTFTMPDWMETATIYFKTKSGYTATCDNGAAVTENNGLYAVPVELNGTSQSFVVAVETSDGKRIFNFTLKQTEIDTYIESISLMKDGNAQTAEGTIAEGTITYRLQTGEADKLKLRVKPRHENTVELTNLTGIPDDKVTGNEEKIALALNDYGTYYERTLEGKLEMVEGTNRILVTVSAGDVVRKCMVIIIIGDENANSTTTTISTTVSASDTTSSSTTESTTVPTMSPYPTTSSTSGGGLNGVPTVLWILIGIIALVIVGSCIFMIVNMSGRRREPDYDYDFSPAPSYRRNLTDYIDDDYDDGYGYDNRRRGGDYGHYNDGYDDGYGYDNRRRGGDYGRYNDGYDDRRRGGSYDDFDDFDDGYNGGGGYNGRNGY